MGIEREAGLQLDLGGDRLDPEIADLRAASAASADDVMVVSRLAYHVGMLAIGQVEPFDEAELLEQLKGPEDGGAADA